MLPPGIVVVTVEPGPADVIVLFRLVCVKSWKLLVAHLVTVFVTVEPGPADVTVTVEPGPADVIVIVEAGPADVIVLARSVHFRR